MKLKLKELTGKIIECATLEIESVVNWFFPCFYNSVFP